MSGARVSASSRDGIAVLTLDNPPVNALGWPLRAELHQALLAAQADGGVAGIVIACAGRTFVAGADISELGTPAQIRSPTLRDICALIEAMPKPVTAAIHGTALGGGLELALACHHRIADRKARFGLPEVKLGLLPGAGGTVRLPRLVGAETALRMIITGEPIDAFKALQIGLIDRSADGELVQAAVDFMREVLAAGSVSAPVRDKEEKLPAARAGLSELDSLIGQLTRKSRGLRAPQMCAKAVRNAVLLPFDEALAKEREAFLELLGGRESRALRHLFFAEREAAKVPGIGKDVPPRPVAKAAVIGAGTMGSGIALALLEAGIPVVLLETSQEALDRGMASVERHFAASVARGSLQPGDMTARLADLRGTLEYSEVAGCDLVIEAAFEDMAVKKAIFRRLDEVAAPGTILATNTSYLDVDEIAASTARPQDVLGLHFFSPAHRMRLVEVVRGRATAPDVIASAIALVRRLGKLPVVVGVCHGFVGNRMLAARGAANEDLLLEGAMPAEIDKAFTDFGWPMGPFQMGDLAGLDIGWRNRKALGTSAPIADALCEQGRFGQKSGRGWYDYEPGSRTPIPDPVVARLIERMARDRGIVRRHIPAQEILDRTHLPMIAEGRIILDEGIALRASDIDLIWVHGYGFPAGKGGPMFWADQGGETVPLPA